MKLFEKIYIDGAWVAPIAGTLTDMIDPATEEVSGRAIRASVADIDAAVAAAKAAAPGFANTSIEQRVAWLEALAAEYDRRIDDVVDAIVLDLACSKEFARTVQAASGSAMLHGAAKALPSVSFERRVGNTLIMREPIGVAALITPWNWPMLQSCGKIGAALAAGCTMVYKPAELATRSAVLMAELVDAVRLPRGVFNMVLGQGAALGDALTSHPDVDYISFTGSGPVGATVAKNAADTAKKVALELGGKSALIILPDADIEAVAPAAVFAVMSNSGQTCGAASRTLVPAQRKDELIAAMKAVAQGMTVGAPATGATLGPVISERQWSCIQRYIQSGLDEGATLVLGGPGKPAGLDKGYFVSPTIFANVSNDMTIAREEIFGPVACVIAYDTVEEAIAIANDSPFGLAGFVFGGNQAVSGRIARQIKAGMVMVNTLEADLSAPWGGYKTSGTGREWGVAGIEEYLETKSLPSFFAKP